MKHKLTIISFLFLVFLCVGCSHPKENMNSHSNDSKEMVDTMKVTINEQEYLIQLEDNEATRSLHEYLPLELSMSDLNSNEKYANLDFSLPTNEYSPNRIQAGDVMLFGDDCLVIFYQSFDTSYSYTKIGHIDGMDDLGSQSIKATFEKE